MATRYWMAPGGHSDTRVFDREIATPPTWDGVPGREIIPVVVGSAEWAIIMCHRGEKVADKNGRTLIVPPMASLGCTEDGWHLLPPSPPPIRKGERVRWTRGRDSGTGTYHHEMTGTSPGHVVTIGPIGVEVASALMFVESVSRIEEEG